MTKFILVLIFSFSTVLAAQHIVCDEVFTFGKIDQSKGFAHYQKLAEQGNPCAQYEFAYLHESGILTKQDYLTARKWYRKAAEQGVFMAQIILANFYANGTGVKQSYSDALLWLEIAQQNITQAQKLKKAQDLADDQEPAQYLFTEQNFVEQQIAFYQNLQQQAQKQSDQK